MLNKIMFSMLCIMILLCFGQTPHALSQMKSWEGLYCDKKSTICVEITKQNVKWDKTFALVTFSSENKSVLIDEGEFLFDEEGGFFKNILINISADNNTVTVKNNEYVESMEPYGEKIVVGTYAKVK